MNDAILLDSELQVTIFKQTDFFDKMFISKGSYCARSSGEVQSCMHLRCENAGNKVNHMFDENSISVILCLADGTDSYRVTMGASIDYVFCAYVSK